MKNSKENILQVAFNEFSKFGFAGARVDRIARDSGLNKAMIFYYFSSKQQLYNEVLKKVLAGIFKKISTTMTTADSAEDFFEKIPPVYVDLLHTNKELLRLLTFDIIQDPGNLNVFLKDFFKQRFDQGPGILIKKIDQWHRQGQITEPDPVQFILNFVSLNFFTFIGQPLIEAIFDFELDRSDDFYNNRIRSIVNLLKNGMLK